MGRSTPSQSQARAGPSRYRASRAPRASQPSQSQRPGRRAQPPQEEEDDDMYEKDDDDDEGDDDGDGDEGGEGADGGPMDVDEPDDNSELARKAHALVRLALFTEYKRAPLRREEISKKVLGGTPRAFASVFALAQKKLRDTFGMELVELATRAGVEAMERGDGVDVDNEGGKGKEKENEGKGKGKKKGETQAGLKKKAPALTTKSYILRSVLPAILIEHAAQTDGELYEGEVRDMQAIFPVHGRRRQNNGDDDEDGEEDEEEGNARRASGSGGGSQAQRARPSQQNNQRRGNRGGRMRNTVQSSSEDEDDGGEGADGYPNGHGHDNEAQSRAPKNYGSIISWSRADQLGALGVLHVILALVLAHARVLDDAKLRAYMRMLRIPSSATAHPIPLTTTSTSPTLGLSLDDFLTLMLKQGYLHRAIVGAEGAGGASKKGGAGAGRGAKRVRGGQDAGAGEVQYVWRWGARALAEIGEEQVARFVAEFMVSANADDADVGTGEDTDSEEEGGGARGAEKSRKKKREAVEKMFKGLEKAAGGSFLC